MEQILYFSRAGENYVNGAIRNLEIGNTEIAARMIHEITNAEMFKIDPVTAYSSDYNSCIKEAQDDKKRDARPELKSYPNLDNIDTIYLGYPNYWGTMPMALFTLLEHFDFTGKRILPFCTHEGSGMGTSVSDIRKLCPDAMVEEGLAIHGAEVVNAKEQVQDWLSER